MTRARLATLLGVLVAISSVLVLLAGSDLPPPPGFALAILVALVIGILVRVSVPRVLEIKDQVGLTRALGYSVGLGLAAGFLVGLVFVALGSGEPSAPAPGLPEIAVFLIVVTIAGGCAAASVSTVANLADRAPTRTTAIVCVAIPGALVLLVPIIVIGTRFAR